MFDSPDAEAYIERAVMHEQLAATTADVQARKMHQAMAEAYRRKAEEAGNRPIQPMRAPGAMMLADAAA